MVEYKKCSKCGDVKHNSLFDKNSRVKSGLASHCKSCRGKARLLDKENQVARSRAWYHANKEKQASASRIDRANNKDKYKEIEARKYLKNRDKILARVSEYQKANPEVNRAAAKRYRDSNPAKGAAKTAKRRARLKQATPLWALEDEWEQFFIDEIYHLSSMMSSMLHTVFHVDHQVPLTSNIVCGLHVSANLQILSSRENIVKLNRWWPDMPDKESSHP